MADESELVPGSRWLDHDGDFTVVLTNDGFDLGVVYKSSRSGDWRETEYVLADPEFFAGWQPYVEPPAKCPDFERLVGFDGDTDNPGFDLDECDNDLIFDTFVFRIGVEDGEPFIEQVKP